MTSSSTETLVDVTMPQMGVSVAEGTIVAWRVEVGDRIEADATICEISTDKIDTDVPAPVSGVVAEILVAVEATVDVGTCWRGSVALAVAASGAAGALATGATTAPPPPAPPARPPPPQPPPPHPPAPPDRRPVGGACRRRASDASRPDGRRYSPVVQRIAAEHGIDLSRVAGTGRGGRVRKQDVLAVVSEGAPAEEPPLHIESPYRPDPVPRPCAGGAGAGGAAVPDAPADRRAHEALARYGRHLHDLDRGRHEPGGGGSGPARCDGLAFVARACIDAIREYPALNAWLEGEQYTVHQGVNLGIAVSLGEDGLIVPVIQNAHELSPEGLAARIRDLARRARGRQLTPDDVHGGTFTITNPGQYGSIMATPVINQPQVAILDFEATIKRPVVVTDADGNDSIAIRPITILGLSWDHRALDGALSAQFLASVKRHLEAVANAP